MKDNDTFIRPSTSVQLDISDYSLESIWYNWDENVSQTLFSPYMVTVPSNEGYHLLNIHANDTVDHTTVQCYWWWVNQAPIIVILSPVNSSFQIKTVKN
ncbi:MAG: hypothetical protein ACTSP4_10055 [Candidatus Hodarchaeales archaeon]